MKNVFQLKTQLNTSINFQPQVYTIRIENWIRPAQLLFKTYKRAVEACLFDFCSMGIEQEGQFSRTKQEKDLVFFEQDFLYLASNLKDNDINCTHKTLGAG